MSNDSVVADHPERLGDLAPAFVRRRIGFGVDRNGQVVLVRPDSVVVDGGEDDDESFGPAIAAIARVDEKQAAALREQGRPTSGLLTVTFRNEPVSIHGEERFSVAPVQDVVNRLRQAGALAEPNHVIMGSQGVRGVPVGSEAHFAGGMLFTAEIVDSRIGKVLKTTSDPAPPPAWLPKAFSIRGRAAPRILVLDTGLRTDSGAGTKAEHRELKCVKLHSPWLEKTPGQIDDEDEHDDDGSGTLDFEAGHGTFIAGIIQQICPNAEVHIGGVLSSFGDGDVANVIAAFELAVKREGEFDIVVMSLGGFMTDDEADHFGNGIRRLLGAGLCVAAAGNQSTSRPYFPAALPAVVGVGGLGQADRAWFTNFGGWVDACAPAIDVVSTFFLPDSNAQLDEPPFTGWARWSGTSFAAPKVAAAVAQEMYISRVRRRHVLEAAVGLPALPGGRPRHRLQPLTMTDLVDFDGPLGALEPELARRRIAVASDADGRLCLVRPDSVVLELDEADDAGLADARRLVDEQRFEVLGDSIGGTPPPSGMVALRVGRHERAATRPQRWGVDGLRDLMRRASNGGGYRVRPNQVYLTDGVGTRFGRVGSPGSAGTPGFTTPDAVASTVRPAAPPAHLPQPLALAGHTPPNVLVLDTGLRTFDARAEHPWLRDHCVVHQPWRDRANVGRWDDEDEPDDDGRGQLDQQAGHGTFISGIIRQLCPDAIVHHRGVLTSYGDGDDASVITAIQRAIHAIEPGIDLVVMAFGTYGTGDEPPPLASAVRRLLTRSLVVASAGNDATARPYYPAALPGVIGVGALDEGGRAAFSNFGPWVDACAPAVDAVSTFFTHVDDHCPCCGSLRQAYRGWARWSGTSFASPKVAGAIAQEMYLRGGSAAEAWSRLSGPARHRLPDLGVVVNV